MLNSCLIVNNGVQGVQGVQGRNLRTLHSCKPCVAWLCGQLCRVCRVYVHGCARTAKKYQLQKTKSLARIYRPLHTLHTLHSLTPAWPAAVQGIFRTLHTLHITHFLKKMKKIVCGEENAKAFSQELKTNCPAFFDLAKALYAAGMIPGLRGATLTTGTASEMAELAEQVAANSAAAVTEHRTCQQCRHWSMDRAGDGTGIGQCHADNAGRLHWPGQIACKRFEVIA